MLVTATADWTTFDTIGGYMPTKGGPLEFRPGVFLEAIRQQKWLIIDEINRADIDKSFGELFTVLSGQAVTLPYQVKGQPVRIFPPGAQPTGLDSDYIIHPNWRIIGTMNVYDKATLFAMSYAFMRRFAFIDVDLPERKDYRTMLLHFFQEMGLNQVQAETRERLFQIFDCREKDDLSKERNPLMRWRGSGPAIARDMVEYLARRAPGGNSLNLGHLAEAMLLYIVPQFDGLEAESITKIYIYLQDELFPAQAELVLKRIKELFPYIHNWPEPISKQGY
jgi:MoxR-like ATPase